MELISSEKIQNRIFTIRGVQVILDKDLALFYDVKPIRLREQVKRNPNRFPDDFVFVLSEKEVDSMVSQNAIPSKQSLGGSLPLVFTEQGVAAVSGVIKSEKADKVSVAIARAFVAMRKFLLNNASVFQRLDQVELKQLKTDEKLEQIFKALEAGKPEPTQGIFFDGQIFDAYAFTSALIKKAKKEIILIDNYIDESTLTHLSKKAENIKALLLTKSITKQLQLDVRKANEQFALFEVKELKTSHDRFLIIDQKELYHLGASLKDLGKKWFAFSKLDGTILELMLEQIKKEVLI
jgi:hypothetical protein